MSCRAMQGVVLGISSNAVHPLCAGACAVRPGALWFCPGRRWGSFFPPETFRLFSPATLVADIAFIHSLSIRSVRGCLLGICCRSGKC